MFASESFAIAVLSELFECISARRLKHSVAFALAGRIGDDKRLVDKRRQQFKDVVCLELVAAAHRSRRLEAKAAGEDADAIEHGLLRQREQAKAPIDERRQRLLTWERGAASAGEQPKAVVDAPGEVGDGEDSHTRSRELDRERNAVKS